MSLYQPDPPAQFIELAELAGYLQRELERIGNALDQVLPREIPILHAPPEKVRPFMLVGADGVDWSPTDQNGVPMGRGIYIWNITHWVRLGDTMEQPPTVPGEEPTPPPPSSNTAVLTALTPTSFSVEAGFTALLTVTIDPAQSSFDTVIALSSSDTTKATVPNSVTVPAGQTQASFEVTGSAAGSATITASYNGVDKQSAATVTTASGSTGPYHFLSSWEEGSSDYTSVRRGDGSLWTNFWRTGQTRDFPSRLAIEPASGSGGQVADQANALHQRVQSDDFVSSSTWVRSELDLDVTRTDGFDGREHWWAASVYIPSDYSFPSSNFSNQLHLQFHDYPTGNFPQPNVAIEVVRLNNIPQWRMRLYGGTGEQGPRQFPLGADVAVIAGRWYDFTWHVKWSDATDGFFKLWCRERSQSQQMLGCEWLNTPTLYNNHQVYFKFGTYHSPKANHVAHDRILRGPTAASVAMCPLEGVAL